MDKAYDPSLVESKIYRMWEEGKYFTPVIDRTKTPFTILLPLPNANDPMHMGHALFTIEDIMIRYHRMKGDSTLWLPGGDHAGIETQYVFEKKLGKEGKSRFDFDRETLYRMISEFVEKNKSINRDQMKRLGFSLDWTRYHYSLEPTIVAFVLDTFRKLHEDNLIYRSNRLVNYCTKCGTAFSDLEIHHVEKEDTLYVLDYGTIQIATTRPETIFADVAVAVHPNDKRYKNLIRKTAIIPLINASVPIISDDSVDMEFGTGALKITPSHDFTDYKIGQKHNLPQSVCIDTSGRLINVPEKYLGLTVFSGRKTVIENLKKEQTLIKEIPHIHTINTCYRCNTVIEPMFIPQWYVKTKPLAEPAIKAIKTGKTKIVPKKRFEKMYFDWMEHIEDWNISRQIVWGPRIPVWYCLDCNPDIKITFLTSKKDKVTGVYKELKERFSFDEMKEGLQTLSAPLETTYTLESRCETCNGSHILQETDTFDTWFLSGQWPITTLGYPDGKDFKYFYPTSVLDTLWDILFFWVARMMMFGLYLTGDVPFTVIHLHSRVVDKHGAKMSKSKNNVMNPIDLVDKYGADALRMALVYGVAPGSDICLSEEKVIGMRNFANKLWNIARLLLMNIEAANIKELPFYDKKMYKSLPDRDKKIISDLNALISDVTKDIEKYRFSDAAQRIYEFTWHEFADKYLEENKERFKNGDELGLAVFRHVLLNILKLLHPFMPFITEKIWSIIPRIITDPLIISFWPK
jgi:valyl-tRNA synthetase